MSSGRLTGSVRTAEETELRTTDIFSKRHSGQGEMKAQKKLQIYTKTSLESVNVSLGAFPLLEYYSISLQLPLLHEVTKQQHEVSSSHLPRVMECDRRKTQRIRHFTDTKEQTILPRSNQRKLQKRNWKVLSGRVKTCPGFSTRKSILESPWYVVRTS